MRYLKDLIQYRAIAVQDRENFCRGKDAGCTGFLLFSRKSIGKCIEGSSLCAKGIEGAWKFIAPITFLLSNAQCIRIIIHRKSARLANDCQSGKKTFRFKFKMYHVPHRYWLMKYECQLFMAHELKCDDESYHDFFFLRVSFPHAYCISPSLVPFHSESLPIFLPHF